MFQEYDESDSTNTNSTKDDDDPDPPLTVAQEDKNMKYCRD